ncbi:hypothetical protein PGB90_003738 [Kerria lacca]
MMSDLNANNLIPVNTSVNTETDTTSVPLNSKDTANKLKISISQSLNAENHQEVSKLPTKSKKNNLFRWFRKKLWCLKSNSPMELQHSNDESSADDSKIVLAEKESTEKIKRKSNIHNLKKSMVQPNDQIVQKTMVTAKKREPQTQTEEIKDRQVTFSDTVRTHIKTKFVTAEEYKQIRGMNPNSRRVMYHIVQLTNKPIKDVSKPKVQLVNSKVTRLHKKK